MLEFIELASGIDTADEGAYRAPGYGLDLVTVFFKPVNDPDMSQPTGSNMNSSIGGSAA